MEHLFVVGRLSRLQEEYLYQRARLLAEVQTCLDDLRIIIHHQSPLRQIVRQVVEDVLSYLTLVVDEQLRVVALSLWELGYALVGQLVIVFANMYVFRFHAAKVAKN